jgi:hypothetical protein
MSRWLFLLGPLLLGCSVQLGGRGGVTLPTKAPSAPARAMWATGLGASVVVPGPRWGAYLGAELEGRGEYEVGSRFLLGCEAGVGLEPEPKRGSVGFEAHFDVGTPLSHAALFPHGDFYLGGTASLVVWLSGRHSLSDVNTSQWLIATPPELVIFGRERSSFDHPDAGGTLVRHDLSAGLAFRVRLKSDLF